MLLNYSVKEMKMCVLNPCIPHSTRHVPEEVLQRGGLLIRDVDDAQRDTGGHRHDHLPESS